MDEFAVDTTRFDDSKAYSSQGCVKGNMVNHPAHYTQGCSAFGRRVLVECFNAILQDFDCECIDFILYFVDSNYMQYSGREECYLSGTAVKYLWRAGLKGDAIQDLQKAVYYLKLWLPQSSENRNIGVNKAIEMIQAEIDRLAAQDASTVKNYHGLGDK